MEVWFVSAAQERTPRHHGSLQGLSRSARAEARLPLRMLQVCQSPVTLSVACIDTSSQAGDEPEVVHAAEKLLNPRLVRASRFMSLESDHTIGGAHLLTGGLGGLGLLTARWIATQGAEAVVLA